MTVTLDELFSVGESDEAQARGAARLDEYKTMLKSAYAETAAGKVHLADPSSKVLVKTSATRSAALEQLESINKAYGGDANAELGAQLAEITQLLSADIQKDWTPTNPVGGTGLTPYDLEGPA